MPRSRAPLTAPIVLAIVLIGVFAIRSRGADNPELTNQHQNCAPVARADVEATAPGVPVDVDVLANDTDADGDPLVFQIVQANGGTATVVDGGTPFDGSDDRVRFTPATPAVPQASFGYRAVDPDGAFGASLVTVFVNDQVLPPAGVQSAARDTNAGACGAASPTETTLAPAVSHTTFSPNGGGRRRITVTTARTATPPRNGTSTTRASPNSTPPSFPPPSRPPTSQPRPTNPPSDPDCGPPPTSGSDAEEEAYEKCLRRR